MANRIPLHSRAAVPEKDRIQTVTNEFIRRYENTSRNLPVQVMKAIIEEYARDLRRGVFQSPGSADALKQLALATERW